MRFAAACLASLLVPMAATAASSVTFTRIADGTNMASDGSALFYFGNPQLSGNNVVFAAESFSLLYRVYAAPVTGGSLVSLVSTNTKVPGGTGNFTSYQPNGCNAPVAGTTSAVFVGTDAAGNQGVYSVKLTGGAITRLAGYGTAIPGAPVTAQNDTVFKSSYRPCNLTISGSTVYFDTTGGDGEGVYSVATTGHGLARVADANTPQGGTPPFPVVNGFIQPTVTGTNVVYVGASTGGPYGLYASGKTASVAAVVTDGNSEGSSFDQFSRPAIGGKTIMFAADYTVTGNSSVLATVPLAGGAAKIIFNDASTKLPAGTVGDAFYQFSTDSYNFLANDGSRLLFTASTQDSPPKPFNTYDGVFSVCRGKLTKVVQSGDAVGTQVVRAIHGISALQRVSVGGAMVERFAAWISLGGATTPPTTLNGAPSIYVVTMPAC